MTQDAQAFFFEHAGYATPPGREECARLLAEAEARGRREGLFFNWELDVDGDLGDHEYWCDEAQNGIDHEHRIEMCLAFSDAGELLASLGSIIDADATYRRVIEAELADEAISPA